MHMIDGRATVAPMLDHTVLHKDGVFALAQKASCSFRSNGHTVVVPWEMVRLIAKEYACDS